MSEGNGTNNIILSQQDYRGLMVNTMLLQRYALAGALGVTFAGRRDLYSALGYKRVLNFEDYWQRFRRHDIAKRVIQLPPSDTWRKAPIVTDDAPNDERKDTPFEAAWKQLVELRGVWHHLHRLDRLSRIGRFGVLLIGVKDGQTLEQPLKQGSLTGPADILFLSPYSERSAKIKSVVTDPSDPRFNLPDVYDVTLGSGDFRTGTQRLVHQSRLIHVAEQLDEDDVYGTPALEGVWNRLDDLEKALGSGAEAAWNIANRGMTAKAQKDYRLEQSDFSTIEDQLEEYTHGQRRTFVSNGFDINPLGGETVDVSPTVNSELDMIAAETGIPKRILIGSERGELASSQDAATWAGAIASRQTNHAEPTILRPFIDRLIFLGALPQPKNGTYSITWRSLFELNDTQKATINDSRARSFAVYRQRGVTPYEAAIAAGHDETMARTLERGSVSVPVVPPTPVQGAAAV